VAREKFGTLGVDPRDEHPGQPFRTELAADARQGRRIATGVTEVMVALEISLPGKIRPALTVALMTGDAVERLEREVGGALRRSGLILLRKEELQRGALGIGKRIAGPLA
jgi:hypothetical protein